MAALQPFHLALPVHDLDAATTFYRLLGCQERRRGRRWAEYDMVGHQIVAHLEPDARKDAGAAISDVRHLPVPHFGVVLAMSQWRTLVERIRSAGLQFALEPAIHSEGQPDEQATFFIYDPSGNAFEFKAFADLGQLFGAED